MAALLLVLSKWLVPRFEVAGPNSIYIYVCIALLLGVDHALQQASWPVLQPKRSTEHNEAYVGSFSMVMFNCSVARGMECSYWHISHNIHGAGICTNMNGLMSTNKYRDNLYGPHRINVLMAYLPTFTIKILPSVGKYAIYGCYGYGDDMGYWTIHLNFVFLHFQHHGHMFPKTLRCTMVAVLAAGRSNRRGRCGQMVGQHLGFATKETNVGILELLGV